MDQLSVPPRPEGPVSPRRRAHPASGAYGPPPPRITVAGQGGRISSPANGGGANRRAAPRGSGSSPPEGGRLRERSLMDEHVHVRVHEGVAVSDAGELVETLRCGCGAAWTKVFRVDEGTPER